MLVKVYAAALQGIDATIVTIEVNSSRGIKFFLVGLPDSAVKESHERIISALQVTDIVSPADRLWSIWHQQTSGKKVHPMTSL